MTPNVIPFQPHEMRAAASDLLNRYQFLRQAGITFNGLRDLYEVLGYSRVLSTADYRDRYERGGISGRIVDVYPNATWRGDMELVEDEDPQTDTEFEQAWKSLATRLKINAYLQRADTLSQLSQYAVLLLGASGELNQELPRGRGPDDLVYLQPYAGDGGPGMQTAGGFGMRGSGGGATAVGYATAMIRSLVTDSKNPRFGLPEFYQLRRTDVGSQDMTMPVHWTRCLHLADGCLDNDVYGRPRLQRVWNLLDDLDKVTGGGSEAFWLRANQATSYNVDSDAQLSEPEKETLKTQAEEFQHQMRRFILTRKVKVESLGSDVANFANPADAIETQIAGALAMPKRILTGSEMGELASSQDRDNWKDQVNGRQTGYAGPYIVRPLVDRLIQYGYLPSPKKGPLAYEVRWPHIQTLTEQEKSAGAKDWASTNQTNGSVVFTDDEIRDKWYGMEPLTPEQKAQAMAQRAPVAASFGTDPTVAQEDELAGVLRAAIEADNVDVIHEIIGLGGPGSGWTAENGHVPNAEGRVGDVVAKSKYGSVQIVRSGSEIRYRAERKNGETVGSFKNINSAKDALRSPKDSERDHFPSGHRFPDVEWKHLGVAVPLA